ncbi:MAG: amidase family protein [Actinomycetota bacterium]
MSDDELQLLDATAQAEAVASGRVSATELVDHAIDRIDRLNPELNAVIWSDPEAARAAAAGPLPDGPFRGVPFLIKDIGATQAGLPYWLGNRALKAAGHRRATDTELGSRIRAAGLITVGKTNLPEVGSVPTTQPLSCGPTANPWDQTRSPAGSSGGAGAAVASGMVAMAHANDGGGSTRLPAAWCGLVGLKTTRGLVPNPENASRLVSELVVTKSVRDTARFLDAVAGQTDADLFAPIRPAAPLAATFADSMAASTPSLRVAMLTDGGRWDVDPACVTGVEAAGALLESLGHHVEPVGSEALLGPGSEVNGRLWQTGIAQRIQALGHLLGRPLTEDEVEPYNWTAAVRGRELPAFEYMGAVEDQQLWSQSVIEWSSQWDLVLTPTAGTPPQRTEDLWPDEATPWKMGAAYGRIGAFTLPFNVTGQPAISLPLHQTDEGLPVGIQLVAAMGRDDLLLSLAADLEQAAPWIDRYPIS